MEACHSERGHLRERHSDAVRGLPPVDHHEVERGVIPGDERPRMPPAERLGIHLPRGLVRAARVHNPPGPRDREIRRPRRFAVRRIAHADAVAGPDALRQGRRGRALRVKHQPPRRQGRVRRGGSCADRRHATGDLDVAPQGVRHLVENDGRARLRRARGQAPPGRVGRECVLGQQSRASIQVVQRERAAVGQPDGAAARPHPGDDPQRAVAAPQERFARRLVRFDQNLAVAGGEADHVRRRAEERPVDRRDDIRLRHPVVPGDDLASALPAGRVPAPLRPADAQAVLRPGAVHGDDENSHGSGQRVLDVLDARGHRPAAGDLGRGAVRREADK